MKKLRELLGGVFQLFDFSSTNTDDDREARAVLGAYRGKLAIIAGWNALDFFNSEEKPDLTKTWGIEIDEKRLKRTLTSMASVELHQKLGVKAKMSDSTKYIVEISENHFADKLATSDSSTKLSLQKLAQRDFNLAAWRSYKKGLEKATQDNYELLPSALK